VHAASPGRCHGAHGGGEPIEIAAKELWVVGAEGGVSGSEGGGLSRVGGVDPAAAAAERGGEGGKRLLCLLGLRGWLSSRQDEGG
jgi:hypothetical protein